MSHHHHHTQLPKGALIGAGLLIAFAIAAAATGRLTGVGVSAMPPGTPVVERQLRFVDHAAGGVRVHDAADGALVTRIEPGADGFVRGVLRGFARARKLRSIGQGPAFVLTRWADGRLSLSDPATGHFVALEAFGPTNADAFARLLPSIDEAAGTARSTVPASPATREGRGSDDHQNT